MGYKTGELVREQYTFMPFNFDELIAEDNIVRVIDEYVEKLELTEQKIKYARTTGNLGNRPYNPRQMLKLYLYGYYNGIRSSRKLERETTRNIEVMWFMDKLQPNFRTISDFRKDHIDIMKEIFGAFSELCDELGLIGKEIEALDGSKFRACNARRKNLTKGKLEKQIEHYEKQADEYMKLLDEEDKKEENTNDKVKASKEEIKEKIEHAKKRIDELKAEKEDVEKNGEKSLTDPDSRHMKASNNGTDIAHNVQIAVDGKHDLVTVVDVTSSPADQGQLYRMGKKMKKILGVKKITVLADKGYYTGEDLRRCARNRIKAVVAVPEKKDSRYGKDKFEYNKEKDIYTCPLGEELYRTGKQDAVYKNPKACRVCKLINECTKNKRGRQIVRNKNEEILERANRRYAKNKELYKRRQEIVEHVFGTVKRAFGYTYFLLIGNRKVKGEAFMFFLSYNMKRVSNILGNKVLLDYIRSKSSIKLA
jgi:transposase